MNNKLVTWKTAFTHLEGVRFEEHRRIPVLVFKYTQYSSRAGPQTYTTRVPVPPGEESTALYVIEQITQQN